MVIDVISFDMISNAVNKKMDYCIYLAIGQVFPSLE